MMIFNHLEIKCLPHINHQNHGNHSVYLMTKLRLLSVQFDTPIDPWELPAFRGAVAAKAGLEHDMFHNHDNESGGFHYRLPLIQYKQDRGLPMLVCLNEGIEELHHFFSQPDWTVNLNGRKAPVRIHKLDVKQYTLGAWDKTFRYHLRDWIGLRDENYGQYTRLDGVVERLSHLQKVLQNQLVALLQQLDCTPETEIQVKIQQVQRERWVTFKGVKVLAFSLEFTANVALPNYIGLGKGCSMGWGVLKGLR
jgi:hypothetical protein